MFVAAPNTPSLVINVKLISGGSDLLECLVGVACESLVGVACETVWWEWLVRVSDGSGL